MAGGVELGGENGDLGLGRVSFRMRGHLPKAPSRVG